MAAPRRGAERGLLRGELLLSTALALLSAALTIHHVTGDSATTDEPVHIAASYEIAREGTGRWNPEHPPLAKAIAGTALLGLDLAPPGNPLAGQSHSALLVRFLHENRVPSETLLLRARLPFALVLVLLLFAVRHEARRRFGPAAGLIALAFTALDPNLIAHAGVVHTDLLVTLFVVLSLGPLSRLSATENRRAAPLLGLFWGFAFLSKFSAPLLAVVTLPLIAAEGWPRGKWALLVRRFTLAAAVAALVVVAGYAAAYRNLAAPDCRALAEDRLLRKGRSPAAANVAIALGDVYSPAGHAATGFLSILLQSRVGAGPNFFLGRVSADGSPLYFPVALATKVPLGLLLGACLGALSRPGRRSSLALGTGLALFLLFSAQTTYNIGVRHALFAFPFAALAASALGAAEERWRRVFVPAGLLGACALELAFVHPYELSFFNAAAGGLPAGERLFADSNVDWGQDLRRLARAAPLLSKEPLPAVVFGGDLPRRHFPALRALAPGDEERPGALVAVGVVPMSIGPELLAFRGSVRDSDRLRQLVTTLRSRGTRVGSIGGSIGIYRIGPGPAPPRGVSAGLRVSSWK